VSHMNEILLCVEFQSGGGWEHSQYRD
jgi:hypothetical protein